MNIFWMIEWLNVDFLNSEFVSFYAQYHSCAWHDTYCSTVNFLSAATLTSQILQKSIQPSVEKILLPNSETNDRKRAVFDILFSGILQNNKKTKKFVKG